MQRIWKTAFLLFTICFLLLIFVFALAIIKHDYEEERYYRRHSNRAILRRYHKRCTSTCTSSSTSSSTSSDTSTATSASAGALSIPRAVSTTKDRYILSLVDVSDRNKISSTISHTDALSHFDQLGQEHQFSVLDHFLHTKACVVELHPTQFQQLKTRNLPHLHVEPDLRVYATPISFKSVKAQSQTIPWGISRIGCCLNPKNGCDGKTNATYILHLIDTGAKLTHPDLNINVQKSRSFHPTETTPDDLNGHGTHVSGIAAARNNSAGVVGAGPGGEIWIKKVLGADGSGNISSIVAAINAAISDRIQYPNLPMVINMSLGAYVGTTSYNAMDRAAVAAWQNRIFVAVAAGNSSADAALFSPAHTLEIVTVGSIDQNNQFSSFSNSGRDVDCLAPGRDILSTTKDGGTGYMSGTSMACPHVAGTAGLYLSNHPTATADQTWAVLKAQMTNSNNPASTSVPSLTTNRSIYAASV